jgi:hypothetical protein
MQISIRKGTQPHSRGWRPITLNDPNKKEEKYVFRIEGQEGRYFSNRWI